MLTGHAADMAGPTAVFAVLLAGLLSYSIALNYCELATTYPVTGGAADLCARSLGGRRALVPGGVVRLLSAPFTRRFRRWRLPIRCRSVRAGATHRAHGAGGGGRVHFAQRAGREPRGRRADAVGGVLLVCLGIACRGRLYLAGGLSLADRDARVVRPAGDGANLARMLAAIALVYNAYVGFEVIADDAEEAQIQRATSRRASSSASLRQP